MNSFPDDVAAGRYLPNSSTLLNMLSTSDSGRSGTPRQVTVGDDRSVSDESVALFGE
jgi:hypothetical protein